MGFLAQLLRRLLSPRRTSKHLPKTHILDLPAEVILLITDQLDRHDQFFLSQTCRPLRRLVGCDWEREMDRLSMAEKLDFWTGLAYNLPDRWACADCCRLHAVDSSDTPRAPRAPCHPHLSRGIGKHYSIQHYHIQLALKYHRLGKSHQKQLGRLMAPYASHSSLGSTLKKAYTAEPKIVNGRFVLREEWVFRDRIGRIPRQVLNYYCVMLCPHLLLSPIRPRSGDVPPSRWASQILCPAMEFEQLVTAAFHAPGVDVYGSCHRCPTDYAILCTDPRTISFRAWHDFGSHGSSQDLSWRAHVWTSENTPTGGLTLHHVPGSIRDLFLNRRQQELVGGC